MGLYRRHHIDGTLRAFPRNTPNSGPSLRPSPEKTDLQAYQEVLADDPTRDLLSQYARLLKLGLSSVDWTEATGDEQVKKYKRDLGFFAKIRAGGWVRRGNVGTELGSLTVGLIGYGNMGQMTARRLVGFGCKVITHDKFRTDYGDEYATEVTLEELQRQADVVSLHIFLEGNHYYVNQEWINAFAKPFYLINTARGPAVNTTDLVEAMESGKVLGAALDVHEYEEQSFVALKPEDLPEPFQYLVRSKNTVLTPHIAGWSAEAEEGHARTLFAKIMGAFA